MAAATVVVVATVDDLPEDVLEYILLHLSPYNELLACRFVCPKWNQIVQGAIKRLKRIFVRCNIFDWYLLQMPTVANKYPTTIAERCSHSACYHSALSYMYVFGGCTASYTTFNDLWKFNLGTRTWERAIPQGSYPTPKACATMVQYRRRLILFGGWSKSSPNPIHQTAMFFNELHEYDPATNHWTQFVHPEAPHLAGHSATIHGDTMVVFGGSHGSGSSQNVYVYNFIENQWVQPTINGPKPSPRYGQSQIKVDERRILIIGGCGGPNLIFSDIWLLTLPNGDVAQWHWAECNVVNPQLSAPQLWSHPACRVGNRVLVLSKALPNIAARDIPPLTKRHSWTRANFVSESSKDSSAGTWTPTTGATLSPESAETSVNNSNEQGRGTTSRRGNLSLPNRRKLISSRSLDEQEPSPPKSAAASELRKFGELQRAQSIPTIIVGEIPKLVVTEDLVPEESGGQNNINQNQGGSLGSLDINSVEENHLSQNNQYIAMVSSGLLPNQATEVTDPSELDQINDSSMRNNINVDYSTTASNISPSPPQKMVRNTVQPSVRPNSMKNRSRQLEILAKMETYIRSKGQNSGTGSSHSLNEDQPSTSGVGSHGGGSRSEELQRRRFRPSSPPPTRARGGNGQDVALSFNSNPMHLYALDIGQLISGESLSVTWIVYTEGCEAAPADTILYSLVPARAELVLFGGMRSRSGSRGLTRNSNLNVNAPFSDSITNETFILKPPISL